MRSVNKVILIGNVTRDPEMRQTQSGQTVCTFGLATNREWITSDGRKKNSAEYHEVVAWAQLAEICQKYVRKGKLLYIEGYLKTRSWDTPEGIRKFKTEVVTQDMIMLEKRSDGGMSHDDAMPAYEDDSGMFQMDEPLMDAPREIASHSNRAPDSDHVSHEDRIEEIAPAQAPETSSKKNLIDDDLGI